MTSSNQFRDYLAGGNIICHTEAASSEEILTELAERLAANNAGLDPAKIMCEVLERESLFPTVIAPGLAVPHARIDQLDRLLVAVGTSRAGIDFHVAGMPPVKVVCLVLSPGNDPGLHLQVLSALARDFRNPARIDELAALYRPSEVLDFFGQNQMQIPEFLRVHDLMNHQVHTLLEQDTLHHAIRLFAATRVHEMAVIDDDGDLRGLISLADILKYSLPEHVMWMEDLSPIYRFQPFADVLVNANDTKIADLMREDFVRVNKDVPAIQLAKLFLTHKVQQLIVVDEDGKLAGTVEMRDFCAKIFWE